MIIRTTTVLCVALLVGLLAAAASRAQSLTDANLNVEAIAAGQLDQPTSMDFVAPNHFLVLEKATGIVRRVTDGVLSPTLALDVAVNSESERGLLGIAVNRETPRKVFLYYTEAAGGDGGTALGNRVYRSIPGTRARGSSRAHSWSSTSRSPRDPITTAVCSFSGLRATERAPATAPTSTS